MIGIIGPADSVALAEQVAVELGLTDDVLTDAYEAPEECVAAAERLDPLCDVLLFTGQVPYALATTRASLTSDTQMIPHSGTDLYRIIAQVLKHNNGDFPTVSVDAIDPAVVHQVFRDLGLPDPPLVLAVLPDQKHGRDRTEEPPLAYETSQLWAERHATAFNAGKVTACLTCLASTHELLVNKGIPTWRIEHTRVTMAEALDKAYLAAKMVRAESSQIAIAMVRMSRDRVPIGSHALTKESLRLQQHLLEHTERIGGHLVQTELNCFMVTSTRGAMRGALARFREGHASFFDVTATEGVRIGVGFGPAFGTARSLAEQSLEMGSAESPSVIMDSTGDVRVFGPQSERTARVRETSPEALALASKLNMGMLSLHRLVRALDQVDQTAVTARELADAYGVQPRSARRLLGTLRQAGYAEGVGSRQVIGSGRPQTVYNVKLAALTRALGGRATNPQHA